MKTKTLLRKMLSAGFLLAIIVIVVMACKKKDDTPTPTPPGPMPTPPGTPDVFIKRNLQLMSDYEVNNNLSFPGHLTYQLGSGIKEGADPLIPGPFKSIGKTLWDVYDYYHTDMEFKHVDDALTQMQNQIGQLSQQISALGAQLNLDVSELANFISTGVVYNYFTSIFEVMDPTTHNGFQYYPKRAAQYKAGQLPHDQRIQDSTDLLIFVDNVYYKKNSFDVCNYSEQLSTLISSSSANAMSAYANLIIQKATNSHFADSASMMRLYQLLECYFLQVVNKQFQCVLVWSNACNFKDKSGSEAKLYYTGTFSANIKAEISAFQAAVDYLVINLGEYRNIQRFENDMNYVNAGLAPDNLFIHVLARSQFISNLLYDALGISYPVVCGKIITPWNYTDGSSPVTTKITCRYSAVGGQSEDITTTATKRQSQIPYTYWSSNDNPSSSPDNSWNLYGFEYFKVPTSNWAQPEYLMQIVDNGDTLVPWMHNAPIKGSINTLFYNPQNPSQTSTTYSTTCCIQFAYFSAAWPWGFLYPTSAKGSRQNYQTMVQPLSDHYDIFQHYGGDLFWCDGNFIPFAGTTGNSGDKNFYSQTDAQFLHPYKSIGTMLMGGNTSHTPNFYMAADAWYCYATPQSSLPPLNGSIQAFGTFKVYYGMKGQGGDDIWVNLGVGIDTREYTQSGCLKIPLQKVQTNISGAHFHDQAGNWNSVSGVCNINPNTEYQPSVEYYYQTYNLPNVTAANIQLVSAIQFVYQGLYGIPDK